MDFWETEELDQRVRKARGDGEGGMGEKEEGRRRRSL